MKIELDRKGLETLVKGSHAPYSEFKNPLLIKAGHSHSDQYCKTSWERLYTYDVVPLFESIIK